MTEILNCYTGFLYDCGPSQGCLLSLKICSSTLESLHTSMWMYACTIYIGIDDTFIVNFIINVLLTDNWEIYISCKSIIEEVIFIWINSL